MSRNRAPLVLGLGVAGAAGYYFYSAGGDPKLAEKKAEHDAARLSSTVRDHLPGSGKEAKTEAKALGHEYGAKLDSAVDSARAKAHEYDGKISSYASDAQKRLEDARRETGAKLNNAVDKFDASVERGAAKAQEEAQKAKGGLSSWFGGK